MKIKNILDDKTLHYAKKIAIVGCSGAGKTTLAKYLGKKLSLPVYHLDKFYWKPGWQEENLNVFEKKHANLCKQKQWIIDGNSCRTITERLKHTDVIIFLDVPRWKCFFRIIFRRVRFHKKQRSDLPTGCFDRLELNYLRYVWRYNKQYKPYILHHITKACKKNKAIRFIKTNGQTISF